MNDTQVLQEFKDAGAILSGHFILSSGLHSPTYLQCARVLLEASRGERLCKALAAKIKAANHTIDVIVAPAMGGVVVGYEMGRQLAIPSMFCERVDGKFELRRGFTLEKKPTRPHRRRCRHHRQILHGSRGLRPGIRRSSRGRSQPY